MKKIESVTLGCDPEIFLEKNGEIISAEGLIGGTKHEPRPISDNGHTVQEDNIAIEYNIPASKTSQEFIDNNNFVKDYLETYVAALGCNLSITASAILDKKYLQSEQAQTFGCEPDFNVWTQSVNEPPQPGGNLRSSGGHIHLGWTSPITEEIQEQIIKAMDFTVGLGSILLDIDDRRKEMYGKAGCFRFKDFGVEYRVLSNFWIKSDESIQWAWDTTMKAVELVNSGKIEMLALEYGNKVVEVINTNNKELAQELIEIVEKELQLELV